MYNILICDDEEDIRYALIKYLKNDNYAFYVAGDGAEAVQYVKEKEIDLLIMDIMMPNKDGIWALIQIREFSNLPIILLTAKSEQIDKINGFEYGADDYITKPFNPVDVRLRVTALLRRYTALGSKVVVDSALQVGGIVLDDDRKQVSVDGEEIPLTHSEYEILKLLMQHPNKCFSPTEIYESIWKENALSCERTVAVHIRHLREKIEIDPANPRYLQAVWGQGYRLVGKGNE